MSDASSYRDGLAVRHAARSGNLQGHTSGSAPGFLQGNLAIMPEAVAGDFLRFCQRNPKPCPIIGVTAAGSPHLPELGPDLDLRTDVPRYRVWRDGLVIDEPYDISKWWRDDLVGFALGCSFSFEEALIADGIQVQHIAQGKNVAMYRTNIQCAPVGPFHGPLVVSMRPFRAAAAIRAVQITTRFPAAHGAPIHLGDPSLIGIRDIQQPDWGDAVPIAADEMPVFWACGVTPQAVIEAAKLPFCITHYPGAMLVTDKSNSQMAVM
jgi:uncharacterized protein YcsI (UPF0317 family)